MNKIKAIMIKLIFILFIIIFTSSTFFFLSKNFNNQVHLILVSIFIIILSLLIRYILKLRILNKIIKKMNGNDLYFLVIFFIVIRIFWIIGSEIYLESDYEVFYNAAKMFSQGVNTSTDLDLIRNIASFQHIIGYSFLLSLFFKAFGTSIFIAQLFNIMLSTISLLLIYKIGLFFGDRSSAFISSFIWAIFPSQIIYTSFIFQGSLVTLLLLLIVYFYFCEENKFRFIFIGILLGILQITRPISIIILIAITIFEMLFKQKEQMKAFKNIFQMLFLFFIFTFSFNDYMESKLGVELGGLSYHTFYVGFSEYGTWNESDITLFKTYLEDYNYSPKEIQLEMKSHFYERIEKGLDVKTWVPNKLYYMWGDDRASLQYMNGVSIFGINNYYAILSAIVNAFYHMVILVLLYIAIKSIHIKEDGIIAFIYMFIIGFACLHLFTEVASRYHYQLIPMSCLIIGIFYFKNNERDV